MEEYGVERKNLMTHHDFRRAIATYWINPKEYKRDLKSTEPHTLKRKSSASTISSITKDSPPKKKIIKTGLHHVTDASLCPREGTLNCRLNKSIDHIPVEATGRARCRLHWWGGIETQAKILACPGCGVSLCVKCYRLFHTEADIVGMKDKLIRSFKNRNKSN